MAIHEYNQHPDTFIKINLKGFIVGNACTHPDECFEPGASGTSMFQYEFLYKHTYYTEEQYNHLKSLCTMGYHSDACREYRASLDKLFSETNTSILNIYSPCYYQDLTGAKKGKLSLKSQALRGELDCDDVVGAY